MKKAITFLILVVIPNISQAQTKFGFRLAPSLSMTKVRAVNGSELINGKSTARASFGPTLDVDLNANISLATGLWYTGKTASITFNNHDTAQFTSGAGHNYALSYLQIPLTIKIYPLVFSKASKLYVQVGATIDYKIAEKALNKERNYFYQFQQIQYQNTRQEPIPIYATWDVGAYLGVGIEWKITGNHAIVTGIAYNRGLLDQMAARKQIASVQLRSFAFEVGMKF